MARVPQPPVTADQPKPEEKHPPPGRQSEQVEHQVRDPCTETTTWISHTLDGCRVRPARVALAVTEQHHGKIHGDQPE